MADQSKISAERSVSALGYRPKSVTLLALGVLLIACLNLIRLVQSLLLWNFLVEVLPTHGLYPHLSMYLALSGLFWGSTGLILVWGLWRGLRWAPWFTCLAVLAYSVYYWIDRLWISADHGQSNWPFSVGLNILCLSYALWTLFFSKARLFFGDLHEHWSKSSTIT